MLGKQLQMKGKGVFWFTSEKTNLSNYWGSLGAKSVNELIAEST